MSGEAGLRRDAAFDRERIAAVLRSALVRVKGAALPMDQIVDDTPLWADGDQDANPPLALDSIDFLEVVVALEEESGWHIPEEAIDVYELNRFGDLVDVIMEHARRMDDE